MGLQKTTAFGIIIALLFALALPFVSAQKNCVVNGEEVPCEEIYGALGWIFAGLGIFILVVIVVGAVFFIFWLLMFIDCLKREFKDKTLWIVILLGSWVMGIGWIAAIVYYFVVKRSLDKTPKPKKRSKK